MALPTPTELRALLELLAESLDNLTRSKYTSAAGLTVVLYDIILLMSDGEDFEPDLPTIGYTKHMQRFGWCGSHPANARCVTST